MKAPCIPFLTELLVRPVLRMQMVDALLCNSHFVIAHYCNCLNNAFVQLMQRLSILKHTQIVWLSCVQTMCF
jgi:hypothetical protein